MPIRRGTLWLIGALALAFSAPGPALAEDGDKALEIEAAYTADVLGVVGGGHPHAGRYLDNFDLIADVDLEKAVGWAGAQAHAYVLNNAGGMPNDLAGALEGVDNIEVTRPRLRLFEFWVEQGFAGGRVKVLAGLLDLNSEFYATKSSDALLGPAYGIGSELSATGPNGSSIFPSTALALRVNLDLGKHRYARVAMFNAKAGVPGDPGGIDVDFDDGVLEIAEAGVEGPTRLSLGAWRYSKRQADIRDLTPSGQPARSRAQGVYFLGEQRLWGTDDGPGATAFLRAGLSDGQTTPIKGGWQAGVLIARPLTGRPGSRLSIGVRRGVLSDGFRANLRDNGLSPSHAELGAEIIYSDRLTDRVTIQPDLQWIRNVGGDRHAPDRVVAGVRITVDLIRPAGAP